MNRTPREDVLAAIVIVLFVAVLAALLWLLALVAEPQPAASMPPHAAITRSAIIRSEGRPPMSAREYVALASYGYGWDARQWKCLDALIDAESHWSLHAKNPTSSASGLFQMLDSPSGKVFRRYKVKDQARIGVRYVAARYATPCKALAHERRVGWF